MWNIFELETVYYTDIHGNQQEHYKKYLAEYVKNVSIDENKTREQFPNLEIDKTLHGSISFRFVKRGEDLTPWILKFGKHGGEDVRDIVKTDIEYLLFLIRDRGFDSKWVEIVKETPEYKEYVENEEQVKNDNIKNIKPLDSGKHLFTISCNPSYLYNSVVIKLTNYHFIELVFEDVKEQYYNGISYYLPVINGKAKRLKGKEFEYDIVITSTEIEDGICMQKAKVMNVRKGVN